MRYLACTTLQYMWMRFVADHRGSPHPTPTRADIDHRYVALGPGNHTLFPLGAAGSEANISASPSPLRRAYSGFLFHCLSWANSGRVSRERVALSQHALGTAWTVFAAC